MGGNYLGVLCVRPNKGNVGYVVRCLGSSVQGLTRDVTGSCWCCGWWLGVRRLGP